MLLLKAYPIPMAPHAASKVMPAMAPRIDILGVYPTVETLTAQVIMLVIVVGGFAWNIIQARKAKLG